jgi:hypothetical protein
VVALTRSRDVWPSSSQLLIGRSVAFMEFGPKLSFLLVPADRLPGTLFGRNAGRNTFNLGSGNGFTTVDVVTVYRATKY